MVDEIRLTDKVALITGGYTALGMALARGFARAGADVGLIARTAESLEEAAREIRSMGVRSEPLVADITDEPQVIAAFEKARRDLGRIDFLVNNTGIPGPLMRIENMDVAEWRRIIDVNLTGIMLCCREAVRHMVPQGGGNIVNISSTAGKRGVPDSGAYSASKWGMSGLTQTLALESGRQNIRVNCINLGSIEGPRTDWQIERRSKASGITTEELARRRVAGTSLGRLVTQDEFVSLALFLASDLSSGMTGQSINLSAGDTFH